MGSWSLVTSFGNQAEDTEACTTIPLPPGRIAFIHFTGSRRARETATHSDEGTEPGAPRQGRGARPRMCTARSTHPSLTPPGQREFGGGALPGKDQSMCTTAMPGQSNRRQRPRGDPWTAPPLSSLGASPSASRWFVAARLPALPDAVPAPDGTATTTEDGMRECPPVDEAGGDTHHRHRCCRRRCCCRCSHRHPPSVPLP